MNPGHLCGSLNQIAAGDYASFGGRLITAADQRTAVEADKLLDEAMLAAIEARFARRFETQFDTRAVHSIWMKWYLNLFIPPILLADILFNQSVSVDLPTVRFVISEDARVEAVEIRTTRNSSGESPFPRLRPLVFEHFSPLIDLWCDRTELTARVLWSNVGNTFEAMLRRIERVSGPSDRLAEAQQILESPTWQGERNPLYSAVHYVPSGGNLVRRRRVCCLQYLLPDRRFCAACPIEIGSAARIEEGTAS